MCRSLYEGSGKGEFLEGLSGSLEHGMYVEKRRRTWEALSSPIGCIGAGVSVGLAKGKRGRLMDRILKGEVPPRVRQGVGSAHSTPRSGEPATWGRG